MAWSVPAYCWASPRKVCLSVPQMPEAATRTLRCIALSADVMAGQSAAARAR